MTHLQQEAKMIAKKYKQPMLITLLYISLYISFRDLMVELLPVFSLAILLFTIGIRHAEVKLGLDVVDENTVIPQNEAMYGVSVVKQIFSTYFWIEVIIFIILIVCVFGIILITLPYFEGMYALILSEMEYGIDTTFVQFLNLVLMISNVGTVVSEIFFNTFFFSAPYILETKNIKGLKAIKEAYKVQKGHYFEVLKELGIYYAFMFIFACIRFLISYFVSEAIIYSLLDILVSLGAILLYESQYVVCKTLLYKKISEEKNYDFTNN